MEVKIGSNKTVSEKFRSELKKNKYLYILLIPVLAYYLIFCYGPIFGLAMAFQNFDISKGIFGSQWVGFKYFKEFFNGIYFTRILKNTLVISLYDLIIGFPVPIIFALMLNEVKKSRFKKVVQSVTYLPHFISAVVVCGMITDFFSTNGIITKLITMLGGEKMNYVASVNHFRSIYVGSNVWQSFGWNSIIYLAALTGVDAQLYEAATIDGAGKWKQLIHVTIPGIVPTVMTMLILRMGQLLNVGYEKIILLYSPSTYEVADIISSYVYRMGLEGSRYSYSAAVGLFQSVVNIILLISANFVSKRSTGNSLI